MRLPFCLANRQSLVSAHSPVGYLLVFRKVSIAGNTINDAEFALAIPVYERSSAIRAMLGKVNVGVALALLLPDGPAVTFGAKAQTERVFLVIFTEHGSAPDAQHTLGPFVLFF